MSDVFWIIMCVGGFACGFGAGVYFLSRLIKGGRL